MISDPTYFVTLAVSNNIYKQMPRISRGEREREKATGPTILLAMSLFSIIILINRHFFFFFFPPPILSGVAIKRSTTLSFKWYLQVSVSILFSK